MHDALRYIGIALVGLGAVFAIWRDGTRRDLAELTDLEDPTYESAQAEALDGVTPCEAHMKIELTCPPESTGRALDLLDAAFEMDAHSVRHDLHGPDARTRMDVQFRSVEVTAEVAHHVLHHFGEGGYAPGSFTRDLIALIARADPQNRRLLALGHPAYVLAVGMAQAPGGVDELREIADSGQTAVIP